MARQTSQLPTPGGSGIASEHLTLQVDHAGARLLREAVARRCTAWYNAEECAVDFALAVSEAFSNAVYHGTGGPEDRVDAWLSATAEGCQVLLQYPGKPFPVATPRLPGALSTHGRGRFLMRELCDEVDYEFQDGITRVRLAKRWKR